MAVSQASHGCARSSWKYTHTGKRVSVGAVCVASLRSVDGEFIAGAFVSAVVAGAGKGNFMEGARSAPTRSRAVKVASGICASMCDQIMNHGGGFAIASWNFCKHRVANAGLARAVTAVNTTLIELYWSIGQYISRKAAEDGWGTGKVAELSRTIQRKYPGMTGYSASNLWRMTKFFEMYCDLPNLAPLVRVLSWTHNLII